MDAAAARLFVSLFCVLIASSPVLGLSGGGGGGGRTSEIGGGRDGRTPEIGTAWLVLSHGAFVSASIGAAAIATAVAGLSRLADKRDLHTRRAARTLAFAWCAMSLAITTWTLFAIYRTWLTANKFAYHVFNTPSFVFLAFVTFLVAVVNVCTLYLACGPRPAVSTRRSQIAALE